VAELTDKQIEALAAMEQAGSLSAAAKLLGISRGAIRTRLFGAQQSGADLKEELGERVAEGFAVKSYSQYTKLPNGDPIWIKADIERQKAVDAFNVACGAMVDAVPRAAPVDAPEAANDDLCNLYTYSDFHLGMLAQAEEGGANWDIKIAERTLMSSFAMMLAQSPPAHTAVVNIQGDMLHSDGLLPVTPAHRHVLDQDGRFGRIVETAIRSIRALVAMALEKHQAVHLVICEGNHDEASSVWLRLLFAAFYENEPRISVNASELPFYVFVWGETMLGFHHGHKVKNEQLPLLFAAQFPQEWGLTKRRAVHCGHRHHCDEKEYNGVTVVQHPTIAARDAYAARGGWIADRAVQSITYSKRFGQVGRVFVTPEMLREAA
jgi:hypothetical protein